MNRTTLNASVALAFLIPMTAQAFTGIAQSDAQYDLIEAQLVEDIGAAERVDAAGRLRTLTQEVAAAACHLHGDINVEESRKLLHESHDESLRIIDALFNGNTAMNIIGAEEGRKNLEALTAFDTSWAATDAAILRLLDAPHDGPSLAVIKEDNAVLLTNAGTLLSEMSGAYSNPAELLQVDALMLDVAGRQSMLTQKMSKEVCTIWSGNRSDAALEALAGSITMFGFSMTVLHDGEPNLGIKPAPTPEIKAGLEQVMSNWADLQANLNLVMTEEDVSDELKADVFHDLNEKMYHLDEIVHLYAVYAKHKYD